MPADRNTTAFSDAACPPDAAHINRKKALVAALMELTVHRFPRADRLDSNASSGPMRARSAGLLACGTA
jgi:hypothetical protein